MRYSILWLPYLLVACSTRPDPAAVSPPPSDLPPDTVISQVEDPEPHVPARDSAAAADFVERGRDALRAQQFSIAIQAFQAALDADSLSPDAYWELGQAHQHLGQLGDALDAWETLATIDPDYPDLALNLPILAMRKDRADSVAALPRGALGPAPEEVPRPGAPLRLAAVGDIQLGQGWPEDAVMLPPNDAHDVLARVAPLLRETDITFGNLETVLADTGASRKCRRGSLSCYAFRVPTSYASTLRSVGFDILSINNNHAGDFQDQGRLTTIQSLDAAGIEHSGPANGAASWETSGLKIALLAFSTGEGPYRVQEVAAAADSVREIKRTHDLVIVSFHGGAEGAGATRVPRKAEEAYGEDRGDVFAFAHAVVDAGADLVLGHGPHVLRGMELYRGRLIAYSLGNFSSWHGFNLRGPLGISVILNVTLAPNGVLLAADLISLSLERPGIPTPDPEGRAVEIIRSLSEADFGNALFDEDGRYERVPGTVGQSEGG